jgi:undecaprenyl pyrophosphate phosphatase UppP
VNVADPGLGPGLAALLGALQGVAEFLPISSSGHLALAQRWFDVDPAAAGHSFNIVVHAGTLLAVLLFYRRDLATLARAVLRPGAPVPADSRTAGDQAPADDRAAPSAPVPADSRIARDDDPAGSHAPVPADSRAAGSPSGSPAARQAPDDPGTVNTAPRDALPLLLALVLGTLPLAAALVPEVEGLVITAEGTPRWVGAGFLVTAALLAFSHRRADATGRQAVPRPWQAVVIGLAQLVAILPGISRSGSTMAAALALGLGRLPAARFSFLLSIPAILGASLKEGLDLAHHGVPAALDPAAFAVGFVVSFLVGTLTLRLLVALLIRVGLLPFVPYLVVLGLSVILSS